jgi:Zn-dependent protease
VRSSRPTQSAWRGNLPVLWAIVSPVSAFGLAAGFLAGLVLRVLGQRVGAWALGLGADGAAGLPLPLPHEDIEPIGIVSLLLSGVGWGRGMGLGTRPGLSRGRLALIVLAGPLAAIVAAQLSLAAFVAACPAGRAALLLDRPSDVLRGVVGSFIARLVLSVAVALLCFGLIALLPLPPLDGSRLASLLLTEGPAAPGRVADLVGSAALLVLAVAPVGRLPVLLTMLDAVGTPLLRIWT